MTRAGGARVWIHQPLADAGGSAAPVVFPFIASALVLGIFTGEQVSWVLVVDLPGDQSQFGRERAERYDDTPS